MPPEEQLDLQSTKHPGVFYHPGSENSVVFVNDGETMIEVYGRDRFKIAAIISGTLNKESPADVKTIY